jgi:hypothetical protein
MHSPTDPGRLPRPVARKLRALAGDARGKAVGQRCVDALANFDRAIELQGSAPDAAGVDDLVASAVAELSQAIAAVEAFEIDTPRRREIRAASDLNPRAARADAQRLARRRGYSITAARRFAVDAFPLRRAVADRLEQIERGRQVASRAAATWSRDPHEAKAKAVRASLEDLAAMVDDLADDRTLAPRRADGLQSTARSIRREAGTFAPARARPTASHNLACRQREARPSAGRARGSRRSSAGARGGPPDDDAGESEGDGESPPSPAPLDPSAPADKVAKRTGRALEHRPSSDLADRRRDRVWAALLSPLQFRGRAPRRSEVAR